MQLLCVTLQKLQGDWQFMHVLVLLSSTLPLGHVETQLEPLKKKAELQPEQAISEVQEEQADGQLSHFKVVLFG